MIESFAKTLLERLEPEWELLIVDDGSTDQTSQILEKLTGPNPRLRVMTHEANRGMGAALVTGFQSAAGDVVITMDADLSHPLELIDPLVSACAQADAAFASRYVIGGGMEGVPFLRAFISRFANLALRVLFATRVRDLTTGFRAYRRDAVGDLTIIGTGFETQLEITVRLVAAGRRILEIPLVLGTRAAGESKMNYLKLLNRYGRMVFLLLKVRWGG